MWVDEVTIEIEAGKGGDGVSSFRREKFVPRGGPDGGSGGDGGSIWLEARAEQNTLAGYRYRPHYRGERGRNGEGANRTGRSGEDLVLAVPPGTLVFDEKTGERLGDLTEAGDRLLVARGGRGGRGNTSFATATNRAPRRHEAGGLGQERKLRLELRLLADVGLVGFPNAGKSTFVSRVSSARPKIADYPFTTLVPHLGVVDVSEDAVVRHRRRARVSFPGASEGAGLGDRFLRHLSRTAGLVYFIDVSEASEREPASDLEALRHEIRAYGARNGRQTRGRWPRTRSTHSGIAGACQARGRGSEDGRIPSSRVSSATGEGCREAVSELFALLVVPEKEK